MSSFLPLLQKIQWVPSKLHTDKMGCALEKVTILLSIFLLLANRRVEIPDSWTAFCARKFNGSILWKRLLCKGHNLIAYRKIEGFICVTTSGQNLSGLRIWAGSWRYNTIYTSILGKYYQRKKIHKFLYT